MDDGEEQLILPAKSQRKIYGKGKPELRIENRVEILRWSRERNSWQSMKSTVIEVNKHGTKSFW